VKFYFAVSEIISIFAPSKKQSGIEICRLMERRLFLCPHNVQQVIGLGSAVAVMPAMVSFETLDNSDQAFFI